MEGSGSRFSNWRDEYLFRARFGQTFAWQDARSKGVESKSTREQNRGSPLSSISTTWSSRGVALLESALADCHASPASITGRSMPAPRAHACRLLRVRELNDDPNIPIHRAKTVGRKSVPWRRHQDFQLRKVGDMTTYGTYRGNLAEPANALAMHLSMVEDSNELDPSRFVEGHS